MASGQQLFCNLDTARQIFRQRDKDTVEQAVCQTYLNCSSSMMGGRPCWWQRAMVWRMASWRSRKLLGICCMNRAFGSFSAMSGLYSTAQGVGREVKAVRGTHLRVCVCVCVRLCMRVCVRVHACMYVFYEFCSLQNALRSAHSRDLSRPTCKTIDSLQSALSSAARMLLVVR